MALLEKSVLLNAMFFSESQLQSNNFPPTNLLSRDPAQNPPEQRSKPWNDIPTKLIG